MPGKPPPNCYWRGKTLWARLKLHGREYRASLHTADSREAKVRVEAWRKKLERCEFEAEGGHSFKEAVVKWAQEVLPQSVKPSAARRYLTSIVVLEPMFGNMMIEQINPKAISAYISSRAGQVKNATLRRDLTALSRLLSACISWGWIAENPARTFDRTIIRAPVPVLVIPTEEEFATVLRDAPPPMAAILRLLDQTGMRENEAVTLEWSDVDCTRRQINLGRTKTSRPRTINWQTVAGDAGLVLERQPRQLRCPFVFPVRGRDTPYAHFDGDFGNLIRRATELERAAGRPFRRFRAHDLRHRFAIRWLKSGGDIYRLSRHLGHTSVKTTEGYLRHLTDDEVDAIRGVAR